MGGSGAGRIPAGDPGKRREMRADRAPAGEKKLLEQACSYIPGSLYLRTQGDEMEILVRGRFLGFRINPLMQLTESTLNASPLPELKPLLELLRRMVRKREKGGISIGNQRTIWTPGGAAGCGDPSGLCSASAL